MAKIPHEALHRIFREDPGLFTRTLRRVLAVDFPEIEEVSVLDAELMTTSVLERRVDTILKAETTAGSHLLVIEPQTEPKDEKIRSWAYYLSYLENKYEIPASLLILTPKERTARWAREPLNLGPREQPSMRIFPHVCGPDNMPLITDAEQASEDVVFSVLALLANRLDPNIEKAFQPLASALDTLEPRTASFWYEYTEGGLGEGCTQDLWRNIMKSMRYVSETRREGRAEGRVEALAEAVIAILDDRDIALRQTDRQRIQSCKDSKMLMHWLLRAHSADKIDDLFDN